MAREIRRAGEDPVFAPTPPLESIRTILSLAATDLPGEEVHDRRPDSDERTQVQFIDIARAYVCAKTDPDDPTYVELPREHPGREKGQCGLLLCHMYGTRKAGDGWHCEYSTTLKELGFEVGDASACVFTHVGKRIRCSVYGDDLSSVGPKSSLDWFKKQLEEKYELKESGRLGPGPTTTRRRGSSTGWSGGLTKISSTRQTPDKQRDSLKTSASKAASRCPRQGPKPRANRCLPTWTSQHGSTATTGLVQRKPTTWPRTDRKRSTH